jgi:GNAT superfamily N-acetyltransferase
MHPINPRPFRAETDLHALVELHNAVEQAHGRPPTLTVERMQHALEVPHVYRYVVDAPNQTGVLAGYGVLFQQHMERCYGDVKVHPAWRRQGIGRELIAALVGKAVDLGTRYLAIDVDHANQDAIRFLLSQGFRFRGDTWALVAPVELALPTPVWPAGYTVKPFIDVRDLPLMVALSNHTFGDLWGHWENTPGLVNDKRMADTLDHYDPRGIFIVFDSTGAAVGQCRALAAAERDGPHVLDQPGIVPDHRGNGLHVPLALTAARWLREQGGRPIRLESWGDPYGTILLYEALGFALVEHEVSYVRVLGL